MPSKASREIKDGMSFPQISTAEMYAGALASPSEVKTNPLDFTGFPASGVASTYESDSFIPDSASTGTSIASGFKTADGIINMDPAKKIKYDPITRPLKAKGYKIVNTKQDILNLTSKSGKVIAINPELDRDAAMPYEIDRKAGELSLSDFVRKGIEVLENDKGFFLMVESGKIDWANHANDAAASIHDTIEFNRAISEAVKVYKKYPDKTLIIVTGDHECGGLTIGFAGTGYQTFFNKLQKQTMSYLEFDKIVAVHVNL